MNNAVYLDRTTGDNWRAGPRQPYLPPPGKITVTVGRAVGLAAIVLLVGAVLGAVAWSWVDGNVRIGDDADRGARYAQRLDLGRDERAASCEAAAEALYDHGLWEGPGSDPASRDQRAFYVGCTGRAAWGIMPGGWWRGGGGGD